MGQNLNLSPVVVFLSLFLWSFLLGGVGMLLAMPLTVLTVIVFEQFEETRWLAVLMSTNPIPPNRKSLHQWFQRRLMHQPPLQVAIRQINGGLH